MSNESMKIVKNNSEQLKIKRKQLSALQTKEVVETEKIVKLSKLLEQAGLDYEICMRSNLAGNASDQELIESKIIIKGLDDSLQEAKEALKFISGVGSQLNSEISALNDEITVHRGIICHKLAKEAHEEIASNKKLNEKLAAGYAALSSSGHYDKSWLGYLANCFPQPSGHEMNVATEKFKASNDFMRD